MRAAVAILLFSTAAIADPVDWRAVGVKACRDGRTFDAMDAVVHAGDPLVERAILDECLAVRPRRDDPKQLRSEAAKA